MPFITYKQLDSMDCGPSCIRMIAKHYGRNLSPFELSEAAEIGKEGVNLLGIAQASEKIGFRTIGTKTNLIKLQKEAPLPCIVHWAQNHFIVVYKFINKKKQSRYRICSRSCQRFNYLHFRRI
jgi:ATP-binding cassette, subfamily B, bacterial